MSDGRLTAHTPARDLVGPATRTGTQRAGRRPIGEACHTCADCGHLTGYGRLSNRVREGARMTAKEDGKNKLLKVRGALSEAIVKSAYFWQMATDERGVIQVFNVGAETMLGYYALEVVDRITPTDISDPQDAHGLEDHRADAACADSTPRPDRREETATGCHGLPRAKDT
jgi:hypothetical protein